MASKVPFTIRMEIAKENNIYDRDYISYWQKDAIKMHAHTLRNNDPIINDNGFGFKYCSIGDKIIGLGQNKYLIHEPKKISNIFNINYNANCIHLISNQDHDDQFVDTVLGCSYGTNKIFYWNEIDGAKLIVPTDSEIEYIGVQYVDGLWILISSHNVYYTTDINKGFNSIKYTNETKYQRIRYNQTSVSSYGDYHYIVGVGDYGEYIRIKINKETKAIVKIYAGSSNDFYGATTTFAIASSDGMGTIPVIVTAKEKHYITIHIGTNPDDLTNCKICETKIYCKQSGKCIGFEAGLNIVSLLFNRNKTQIIESAIIDIYNNISIITGEYNTYYNNPELWGYDTKEYYMAYSCTSGKNKTTLFSCKNGIDWFNNWGYIYVENIDKSHNNIISIIKKLNNITKKTDKTIYVGNKFEYKDNKFIGYNEQPEHIDTFNYEYKISIPLETSIVPKKIIIISNKIIKSNNTPIVNEITFKDRENNTWYIKGNSGFDAYDAIDDSLFVYGIFDFVSGKWETSIYNKSNPSSEDFILQQKGKCEWGGDKIILSYIGRENLTSIPFCSFDIKNKLYEVQIQ